MAADTTAIKTILLFLLFVSGARATCPERDQIHCGGSDKCTRIRYICDGDNDCGDYTDEDSELCSAWRNPDCERNSAKCIRNGRSDCVTISHYCTVTDPPCEGTLDPRICQMLRNEKIQKPSRIVMTTTTLEPTGSLHWRPERSANLMEEPPTTEPPVHASSEMWSEEFNAKVNKTIRHAECPPLFTLVGEKCISIFFMGNLTWIEARAFCKTLGGDLFTIGNDFNNFATILQHLRQNQITADFWIGGMLESETAGWSWIDEVPMSTGSPYWAVRHLGQCQRRSISLSYINKTADANDGVCYDYTQAPEDPPRGHCASITYKHYHYVSDEDCFQKMSPLCIRPEKHPKQAL